MGVLTAIGMNVGKAFAEASKPALEIVDQVVTDRDLALKLQQEIELAYSDKNFALRMALANGNDLQRIIEPVKEVTKIFIIACIFIIFPLIEAIWSLHIDIVKYLNSMPMIGWIVLVAADLGPTLTNRLVDYHLGKKVFTTSQKD